jgi:hypothetical protein
MKVVAMVVLVLAACELIVRLFERRLAVDARVPAISKRLAEGEGRRVLVLGNSLVRDDVDTDILETEMRAQGVAPIHIERVYLPATLINDWYYAFKHHFVDAGRLPDMLILCFAKHHLQDYPIQRSLIARYHSSLRDIPQIFEEDVPDFDGRIEFLLSAWSASFTHRTGVERRVFDGVIPHYRESALRINRFLNDDALSRQRGNYQPTYRGLEQLIKVAEGHGVRVILVALPVQSSYPIAPEIKSLAETGGATLIDSRSVAGLSEESYADEVHMSSTAAAVYSHFLARQLADHLKRTPGAETYLQQ